MWRSKYIWSFHNALILKLPKNPCWFFSIQMLFLLFPSLVGDKGRRNGWVAEYWTRASCPKNTYFSIRKVIAVNFQTESFSRFSWCKSCPSPWPKWSASPHSAILKGANISNIPHITASNISYFHIFSIQPAPLSLSYENM